MAKKNFDGVNLNSDRDDSVQGAQKRIFNFSADDDYRERIIANPMPIDEIWPDRRQPRRAVPLVVRGQWDGDPAQVPDLLRHWQERAAAEHREIDVGAVLAGRGSLAVPQEDDVPVYKTFAKLVLLAQNIANEGLTNPITVARYQGRLQLETGERRWLAFHLLMAYTGDEQYAKIPAREVEFDVFRQASENNARDELNAIQMARQVALLIMNLLEQEHDYASYDEMVLPGENDRKFYAQVSNGYVHSVPEGMRGKIQKAVRGLSWNRVSEYRSLLELTGDRVVDDAIWLAGDTYDWAEGAMRELKVARKWSDEHTQNYLGALRGMVEMDSWSYDDLRAIKEEYEESFAIAKLQKEREEAEKARETARPLVGRTVNLPDGNMGNVAQVTRDGRLEVNTAAGRSVYDVDDVTLAPEENQPERQPSRFMPSQGASSSTRHRWADEDLVDRWVRLRTGLVGIVVEQGESGVRVRNDSGNLTSTGYGYIEAIDVDPIDGSATPENEDKMPASSYVGVVLLAMIDGRQLEVIANKAIDAEHVQVFDKHGNVHRVHVDDVEVNREAMTANKSPSMQRESVVEDMGSVPGRVESEDEHALQGRALGVMLALATLADELDMRGDEQYLHKAWELTKADLKEKQANEALATYLDQTFKVAERVLHEANVVIESEFHRIADEAYGED